MEIKEISDKATWESFLLTCREKTFLDSWNWGEFQKISKNKIWRLGIFEGENIFSLIQVIKVSAKRGTFLFLPHNPVVLSNNDASFKSDILKILLPELIKIAKQEKAAFIRIAPVWEKDDNNNKIFKKLGFRDAPIHMHPELTWELDISLPEEEILAGMRKTTRYLIRQAQKNSDVQIIKSQNINDIDNFNDLYQKTVDRHHFVPFSLNYLKNEFSVFNLDGEIEVFLGKYKGEILTGAMIIYWQGNGFYHQGASSLKYPKIPVSYYLQWEAIREAKKRGCLAYNFWGIAPDNNPKHPWAGLSLFKIGFGGYKKEYVKTQDLPLNNKYWFNYLVERLRKSKRSL